MRDPRLLDWLRSLRANERALLWPMRVLQTKAAWESLEPESRTLLEQCNVQPVLVESHDDVRRVLEELARRLSPEPSLVPSQWVVELDAGDDHWRARLSSESAWQPAVANPLRDPAFRALSASLRQRFEAPTSDANREDGLRVAALEMGNCLAQLLGSPTIDRVRRAIAASTAGRPTLTLRVRSGEYADAALALPWELLVIHDGEFAVEQGKLALVREAFVDGAPPLPEPTAGLSLVVSIAAPENATTLRYEDEARRLLDSLRGQRARFAELGTLDDFASTAARERANALHFSGHGVPGSLLFEDDYGDGVQRSVTDVARALSTTLRAPDVTMPSLFFLASCHGSSITASAVSAPQTRSARDAAEALGAATSTAATLHREGFSAVIGFFGSIDDRLCTRVEAAFYKALAAGETLLQSIALARRECNQPTADVFAPRWPFAWAQIAVYLRGADGPLAVPNAVRTPVDNEPEALDGLPSLEHGFIGRRATQHEMRRLTRDRASWFLLLHGLGGLGKTALATHMLVRVFARDPADVCVVRCDSVDRGAEDPVSALVAQLERRGAELAIPAWSETVSAAAQQSPTSARLFERLAHALWRWRPALVLYIDNAETLQTAFDERDEGSIGSWIASAREWGDGLVALGARGRVLVTSRYRWESAPFDRCLALGPMRGPDGERLIESLPALSELPPTAQQQIAERVSGHPATAMLLSSLARQWRQREESSSWTEQNVAEMLSEISPEASQQIEQRLLLDRLWQRLSEQERADAKRIALLHEAAPERVLTAVTPTWKTLRRIGLLSRITMPVFERAGEAKRTRRIERWSLLPLVVEVIARQKETIDETAALRAWADAWRAWIDVGQEVLVRDRIEAARLLFALNDSDDGWRQLRPALEQLAFLGAYREALELLARVPPCALDGDLGSDFEATAAQLLGSSGRYQEAVERSRRAVSLARSKEVFAKAHLSLGVALRREGALSEARIVLQNLAAETQRDAGYAWVVADVLREFATVLSKLGDYRRAEAVVRAAIAAFDARPAASRHSYDDPRRVLATVLAKQAKFEDAEQELRQMLATDGVRSGVHPDRSTLLTDLASVLSFEGKFGEAEQLLNDALAIKANTLGEDHVEYAASLYALGGVLAKRGDGDGAVRCFRRALSITEAALGTEHPNLAPMLNALAQFSARTAPAEALALAQRSERILQAVVHDPRHPDIAHARLTRAWIEALLNDPHARDTVANAVEALTEKLSADHPTTALALQLQANIDAQFWDPASSADPFMRAKQLLSTGRASDAVALLVPLTEDARAAGTPAPEFTMLTLLAQAASHAGDLSTRDASLARAAELLSSLPPDAAQFLASLRARLAQP